MRFAAARVRIMHYRPAVWRWVSPCPLSPFWTGGEGIRDSLEEWGSAKGPEAPAELRSALRGRRGVSGGSGGGYGGGDGADGAPAAGAADANKLHSPRSSLSSAARSFKQPSGEGLEEFGPEYDHGDGGDEEEDEEQQRATGGERRGGGGKSPIDRIVEASMMDEIDEGDYPIVP